MKELVKVSEALKQLPVSRTTIIRLLHKGKIKGVQIGRNWFVYSSEIERIKTKGTKEGG